MSQQNNKRVAALKQLKVLEKLASDKRLAADGWDEDWKVLIATLMSARTTDKKTIPTAELLFNRFKSLKELNNASEEQIAGIIRPVNFYKTKAKNIKALVGILIDDYDGVVPHDFNKLTALPGVGRKTANVFLAEKGHGTIGVDTHVQYISRFLGWTSDTKGNQEVIEGDLESLFPKSLWGKLNWVLVRFGQTYTNRKEKDYLLSEIKNIRL